MVHHTIELNNVRCYAYHGCLPEEAIIGQNYRVDIQMTTNFQKSTMTDELSDTIDYVLINKIVVDQMAIRSKLIEHVGHRIVEEIKQTVSALIRVRVKIIKYCPPINGDVENVAIIIEEEIN
jgi:dihydroneopterin aldolase